MKALNIKTALVLIFCFSMAAQAGTVLNSSWKDVVRGNCSDQNSGWWSSAEAIRITENVLLYQREIGGWPKNTNMQLVLTQDQKDALLANKHKNQDCTIDNGAVDYELTYLSKVYKAISDSAMKAKIKAGFQLGVQYLLEAQYDNGGWPQFYPFRGGYSNYITYNDDAMINVMEILEHVFTEDNTYPVDIADSLLLKAELAYNKGIECILNTQYIQNGRLTVWCAQHDDETLEPMTARSYELASLSGQESAGILEFLMSIDNPSKEIKRAVYSGIKWYEEAIIRGIKLERFTNNEGLSDLRVVEVPNASPLWARFYTLRDNRPFFCDRDGIMKFSLAEIGYERRNGYSWYNTSGNGVASAAYSWKRKWGTTILAYPYNNQVVSTTDTVSVRAFANKYSGQDFLRFEMILDTFKSFTYSEPLIDTVFAGLDTGRVHSIIVKSVYEGGYSEADTAYFTKALPIHKLKVYRGDGDGDYPYGTDVTIVADDPRTGTVFDKWIWLTDDTAKVGSIYDPVTTLSVPDFDVTIRATYKASTSINTSNIESLTLYPNPVTDQLRIDNVSKIRFLELYSLAGKKLMTVNNEGRKSISINTESLLPGNYLVKFLGIDDSVEIRKFTKL